MHLAAALSGLADWGEPAQSSKKTIIFNDLRAFPEKTRLHSSAALQAVQEQMFIFFVPLARSRQAVPGPKTVCIRRPYCHGDRARLSLGELHAKKPGTCTCCVSRSYLDN